MIVNEGLANALKVEPKTKASRQAKSLGLRYMGFGRYAGKDGKISYVVDKKTGTLVPYKSEEEHQKLFNKYSETEFEYQDGDEKSKERLKPKVQSMKKTLDNVKRLRSDVSKEVKKHKFFEYKKQTSVAKSLKDFYKKDIFSDNEIRSINHYTSSLYADMNRYLYSGYEPGEYNKEDISSLHGVMIDLDGAFEDTEAPFNFSVYSGLGESIKETNLQAGEKYVFRGYVSTSLNHNTAIEAFTWLHEPNKSRKNDHKIVLQIDIEKGDKGIYVPGVLPQMRGEDEFLLPRGTTLEIISGPHQIDSTMLDEYDTDYDILVYHCRIAKEE